MFSKDACKPALPAQGHGFYWQAMGPYTCSMGEAGEKLVQLLLAHRELWPLKLSCTVCNTRHFVQRTQDSPCMSM